MNRLKFTRNVPDKEGYYYFTNFGEHTPVVLEVTREGKKWWATKLLLTTASVVIYLAHVRTAIN